MWPTENARQELLMERYVGCRASINIGETLMDDEIPSYLYVSMVIKFILGWEWVGGNVVRIGWS